MALLNITNFDDHPQEPLWLVFRFHTADIAAEFMLALRAEGIPYEEAPDGGPPFLVGVKQRHRNKAVRVNYAVIGKHRAPFIADGVLRWGVIILVALLTVLAGIGMMHRP